MKEKFQNFMKGRYGTDHFSNFLLVVVLLLMVLQLFLHGNVVRLVLSIFVLGILIYSYFRIFSRNQFKRYRENENYLKIQNAVFSAFHKKANSVQKNVSKNMQSGEHCIFKCPHCGQNVRVPRGKGKIVITCPKCKNQFQEQT